MVQVIGSGRNPKQPSFLQSIVGGLVQGGNDSLASYNNQKNEMQKLSQEASNKRNLQTEMLMQQFQNQENLQKSKFQNEMELQKMQMQGKQQEQAAKLSGENQEKLAPFQAGLQTIDQMKRLRKKGNLGIGASYSLFGDTRKEASEYEQLGKSLISLASTIPIRNKSEFETLAHSLYDPNMTDASAEGVLDAMQRIIEQNMKPYLNGSERQEDITQKRPPISSFKR